MTAPAPDLDLDRDLATFLRARRIEQGRTQEQIATRIGVSSAALTQWERGSRRPSYHHRERWAGALGYRFALILDPQGAST